MKSRHLSALTVYLLIKGTMAFAFALIFTVNLIYHAITVGLNPLQLVLVGTALEVTAFLLEVPTGVVADTYSRRLSVIIGIFLFGVGFTLEGSIPTFEAIVLAQLVWGAGITFISGALDAWIVDEIGVENAQKTFVRGSQVDQVAGIFGIIFSVILGTLALQLPILVGAMLYVVLGITLIFIMPETGFQRKSPAEHAHVGALFQTLREGIALVRVQHVLLTILALSFVLGLFSEGYDRLWTKHILTTVTLPKVGFLGDVFWFGVLRIVGAVLTVGVTEGLRRRIRDDDPTLIPRFLAFAYAMMMVGIVVFAQSSTLWLMLVCFWTISTLRDASDPFFSTWLNQNTDSSVRATVISMSSQSNAIGQIAGGPVIGYIGVVASVRVAITIAGLLLAPALFLLRPQHRQPLPLIETEKMV